VTRVLFVSNGHGEAAIADRIAIEVRALEPGAQLDHLALVGDGVSEELRDVGPQRAMPSGGLIAMGNVRNIARDVSSGLLALTYAQYRFLRGARREYDAAVAVGDVYALLMTLRTGLPVTFVGTAKSVNVAPYGAMEERVLRRAVAVFVRDDATQQRLLQRGIGSQAANVIVDLFATGDDPRAADALARFDPALAVFPGSRASAYDDAGFMLELVRDLSHDWPALGAALSIARGLDVERFIGVAKTAGWNVTRSSDDAIPFVLCSGGREVVRAWRGALGPILSRVSLVLGQAGTANEAAAAAGVPVAAFERRRDRKTDWYRKRQRGLLDGALAIFPGDEHAALGGLRSLLADPARRERMGAIGRERMGAPGGAARIAQRILAMTKAAP
jgi:uncharacterized protein (TIGR03492 family)